MSLPTPTQLEKMAAEAAEIFADEFAKKHDYHPSFAPVANAHYDFKQAYLAGAQAMQSLQSAGLEASKADADATKKPAEYWIKTEFYDSQMAKYGGEIDKLKAREVVLVAALKYEMVFNRNMTTADEFDDCFNQALKAIQQVENETEGEMPPEQCVYCGGDIAVCEGKNCDVTPTETGK